MMFIAPSRILFQKSIYNCVNECSTTKIFQSNIWMVGIAVHSLWHVSRLSLDLQQFIFFRIYLLTFFDGCLYQWQLLKILRLEFWRKNLLSVALYTMPYIRFWQQYYSLKTEYAEKETRTSRMIEIRRKCMLKNKSRPTLCAAPYHRLRQYMNAVLVAAMHAKFIFDENTLIHPSVWLSHRNR